MDMSTKNLVRIELGVETLQRRWPWLWLARVLGLLLGALWERVRAGNQVAEAISKHSEQVQDLAGGIEEAGNRISEAILELAKSIQTLAASQN